MADQPRLRLVKSPRIEEEQYILETNRLMEIAFLQTNILNYYDLPGEIGRLKRLHSASYGANTLPSEEGINSIRQYIKIAEEELKKQRGDKPDIEKTEEVREKLSQLEKLSST